MMERLTRREARARGLKVYWPPGVCAQGHDAMRRVSGPCVVCESEAGKRWKAANPDKVARTSAAEWAKKNPERHRANSTKWIKANGWYAVKATGERRARKLRAEGSYTKADIDALYERQKCRCALCDAAPRLEVDHIIPLSKGGTNWPWNLQLLCRACNARKSSKIPASLSSSSSEPKLSCSNVCSAIA